MLSAEYRHSTSVCTSKQNGGTRQVKSVFKDDVEESRSHFHAHLL